MRNPLEDVTGSIEDFECCLRIVVRADAATVWRFTSLLAVSPDEEDDEDATDAW